MSSIQDIVAAVDFKSSSRAALARAATLAKECGASLHLVHGIGSPSAASAPDVAALPAVWDAAREHASQEMAKLRAELEDSGTKVTSTVSELAPVQAILAAIDLHEASLVVMGTHGYTGLKHAIMGSVAESVLRESPRPVLTVREDVEKASAPIRHIVVATDLDEASEPATAWAFEFASAVGAEIELVHIFSFTAQAFPHTEAWSKEIEAGEQEVTARLRAESDRYRDQKEPARIRVLKGDSPAVLIARHADEVGADLIVLGTHGYHGIKHAILGSVAEATLRRSSCSVMTVKAES